MRASWKFPRDTTSKMVGAGAACANRPATRGRPERWPPAARAGWRVGLLRASALDYALKVAAGRQRAVLQAPVAGPARGAAGVRPRARGAEGVGHRGGAVAYQQRALQAQRHAFDHPPGSALERRRIGELPLELAHPGVQTRVGAAGLLDLIQEHLERSRRSREGPQDV